MTVPLVKRNTWEFMVVLVHLALLCSLREILYLLACVQLQVCAYIALYCNELFVHPWPSLMYDAILHIHNC